MLPLRRIMQPRLLAAAIASVMALVPLSTAASSNFDVDVLWNQPDGISVDSGWYVVQGWLSGLNSTVADDPTQRGLDELAQANADLQNAYRLLNEQRTNPGPHPVALLDPLLSGVYNAVTGSNISAPIGSFFDWVNQGMLKLEGRGSTADIARYLLQDYRVQQAVGLRDVRRQDGSDLEAMISLNTQREQALLLKISAVSPSTRDLKTMIGDADKSTVALAAKHDGHGTTPGKGSDGKGKDKSSKSGGSPNKPSH
jgi:hypothetical protein